jgi:hypothetical protein|tara:strand:- start:387 stop:707 length:321 start_codon:yes stop_codon:yes gene_type:complete
MNIEPFLQLGAVGVLGAAFIIVIRWMLEQMTSKLNDVSIALKAGSLVQLDMHKTLIVHDAQIRGVNPTAGNDVTEMHANALAEYQKVLQSVERTADVIRESMVVGR